MCMCVSVGLSVSLTLSVYMCICLSVCLLVCLFVWFCICRSVYLSVCLSVYLCICWSVWFCICVFFCLSICVFVCLSHDTAGNVLSCRLVGHVFEYYQRLWGVSGHLLFSGWSRFPGCDEVLRLLNCLSICLAGPLSVWLVVNLCVCCVEAKGNNVQV